ncbi:MAG TPA: pyridoxal-dependent decarboxylase, partial [Isosphaeraceae bacterium]|nr:pyridoxal-dependent decarboxylase [Isosphaeraceae bacterium]
MTDVRALAMLLHDTADRAVRYLESLEHRSVQASAAGLAGLARLQAPLPEGPREPADVLAQLDEIGSPATMASAGGRYFGFVIGGSLPAALAANWLATAWDQNAGLRVESPIAAALEDVALGWLVDLLALPPGTGGGFVTCATAANVAGLAAARHALLAREGWDVEARGLFGAPSITVVVGDEVHSSVLKALTLLGFGRERVVRVPVDDRGRMRADALPALAGPTIICLQAGNV